MRTLLLITAIGLIAFLVSLDGFIVNVAIPTIAGELGVRNDVGTWIVTVFSMASTLCIPLSTWLFIHYGSRRLFILATVAFGIFSLLCGLAPTFSSLLIFRILQGGAAGLLTPLTLALILSSFPPDKRSVGIGLWSFFVMVSPSMGPMVGGLFSSYLWHMMFFFNLPLCLLSAFTVWILLKNEREERRAVDFDFIGILLIFISVSTLQSALNRGQIYDWFTSPLIDALLIISLLSFVFFVVWECYQDNAFLNLTTFKRGNFSLAASMMALAMGLIFSSFVLDSLWVQRALGYTPFWAGLSLAPVGAFPLILYPVMGKIVGYLDRKIWLTASFILCSLTFFSLSWINLETPFVRLAIPRLIQGIALPMFTVPLSLIALEGTTTRQLPFVISLFSFCRTLVVGLAIPLATTLWIHREAFYQTRLMTRTFPHNPIFQEVTTTFSTLQVNEKQTLALANELLANQASTLALADIYYLYGWIFLGLLVFVGFVKQNSHIFSLTKSAHGENNPAQH